MSMPLLTENLEKPAPQRHSDLQATWHAWRAHPGALVVFSAVFNLLMLTPSLYMLQVFDRVLLSRSELTLLAVSLVALGLLVLLAVADGARGRLLGRCVARLDQALAPRVLAASFDAALGREQGRPSALQAGEPLRDWSTIKRFLNGPGVTSFLDAPWTPLYVLVLFMLHPALGVLALVFVVLQALLAWQGHRRLVEPKERAEQAQAEAARFVQAKLRNAEVIAAMGMTPALLVRWQARQDRALQAQGHAEALGHHVAGWSKWLRYSQQSLGLAAGALLVIHGEISAGAMIAASFLLLRALAPVEQLVGSWPALIQAMAAFHRLDAQLATQPDDPADALSDALNDMSAPVLRGELVLRQVSVTAPSRLDVLLQGVSLVAQPGTLTLITGPSGSGKSSLAQVLVGLWPPAQGEVTVDDQPAAAWASSGWGGQLGYLPQDVLLGEGTVADNIARMGEPDANRVIAAARAVGLHHVILSLPQGYDTPVGPRGGAVSGGIRQRIALARALYGEPQLLVLDEPNAQLDEAGEAALLACLQQLKARGATVVLISHRPVLRGLADQVVSLHAGTASVVPMPTALTAWRPPAAPPLHAADAAATDTTTNTNTAPA